MNPDRRPLKFASFDEIVPDIERLIGGHRTVGNWTLGQICDHLAAVHRLLVDAPAPPEPSVPTPGQEEQKRRFFATGEVGEGRPMPGVLHTPAAKDAAEAAEEVRDSLAYYRAATTAPATEHPWLGPLTKDQWDQVVLIHAAHHLSFAIPTA